MEWHHASMMKSGSGWSGWAIIENGLLERTDCTLATGYLYHEK